MKFRILQLLLESCFPILKRGLGNFAAVYYTMVLLPRQGFSESLESGLSSEKLAICEISHFTNFNRILVYFPCKKIHWYLKHWMKSMWHECFWKKIFRVYFKKPYFANFGILKLFLNTFFIYYKDPEELYRYLKIKCYQLLVTAAIRAVPFKKRYNLLRGVHALLQITSGKQISNTTIHPVSIESTLLLFLLM